MSWQINVYRDGGTWYGARWWDGEYDGCDELGIPDSSSEADAFHVARTMVLVRGAGLPRKVLRVEDVNQTSDID